MFENVGSSTNINFEILDDFLMFKENNALKHRRI